MPAFIGVLGIAGHFEFPPTLQVLHHGAGSAASAPPQWGRLHCSARTRLQYGLCRAYPGSPVCLQCGPVGRTPAPPHAALPGLATPRSPALASIFCVPTSLRVPLHTRLRPAGQLAAQPATRSHGVLPASHQRTGPSYLATTLAGRRSYADKVSLSFMISAVVCSVPLAASASTYRLLRDSNNRRDAGYSTDVALFFTRYQRKIASVLCTAKPSDFSKPPTHPACTIRPADTPGGSPCRLSSGSWALRAISNFPPHFRFFITGQVRPQARLLNGAACTVPRARVFNAALPGVPRLPRMRPCRD